MNIQMYRSSAAAMVAVSAAIFAAPFAARASFLGDLAANPNVVSSSPYATGGDLVLKLGEAEYVHIFTNTAAAATFTPAQALTARILVVGGGGPGDWGQKGWTGGGGAGGLVERSGVALEAGTDYAVTVGVGGDMQTSSARVSGSNSFFDSITAYGGGYGGGNGWGATKGGNGGSGGGAQYNEGVSGGSGTAGQGNAGGSIVVTSGKNMCGGGGGAGSAGPDITAANILGHGGDGREHEQEDDSVWHGRRRSVSFSGRRRPCRGRAFRFRGATRRNRGCFRSRCGSPRPCRPGRFRSGGRRTRPAS